MNNWRAAIIELDIFHISALLFIAAVVALLSRRLHIPYAVGLVCAGIVLALIPVFPKITLSKDLIYDLLLPPLIFEAALYIRWKELKNDLLVILTLAILGVIIAAGFTTLGMHFIAGWEWTSAALFGTLIAATDPVSIFAIFKDTGISGRLRLLVEAESLFNDGIAVVLFGIALSFATNQSISAFNVSLDLVKTIGGGILCGGVIAGFMLLLAGRTKDHLIEITFTTIAAFGSFFFAEQLHVSGVLATLTAGLLVGNIGPLGSISTRGRESVESFWEYIAFVINSIIFILIGIQETYQNFSGNLLLILLAIGLVIVGRAIAIYSSSSFFSRSKYRIDPKHQHILFWGGLRGALALALVLGLSPEISHYQEIVTITFSVVAFSIIVQGLTLKPLLRWIGLIPKPNLPEKSISDSNQ